MASLDVVSCEVIPRTYLENGKNRGTGIAVLTSGGDAQGMNAALRGVVRTALFLGCSVYFVREGYQGLVDGQIVEANWSSVSSILQKGGTIIGSARCLEFREREGRLKAAKNLVEKKITKIVIIGGDGSLTGANIFRNEWPSLLAELKDTGQIPSTEGMEHIDVVGIVGSIDNDFCGTDMTIGTDSALHRILEAIDAIVCTAYSHQRAFVMEVMGRRCGYLALSAGLLSGATSVFLPEEPAAPKWQDDLCLLIEKEREAGQRLNIIIVAEGAQDDQGKPITCDMVKDVITDRLKIDTRVTILGHIQRGGEPSAFDRIIGARMGIEAVLTLLEATPDSEALVINLSGTQSIRIPLMQCVKQTQAVAKALDNKQWSLAQKLRGKAFLRRLEVYKQIVGARMAKKASIYEIPPKYNILIIHIGSPACGMNAAIQAFVQAGIDHGMAVFGAYEGLDGLVAGRMHQIKFNEVIGWVGEGGALLGTKRALPYGKFDEIAEQLRNFEINGLLIIGGFEAYQTALELQYARKSHKEFRIPILVAVATISNNVPGCDLSLGCDTALNEIVDICDRLRQSAQGTKRRLFICETMGGFCGYLATMAGLAGGADAAYIYEETFSLRDLQRDLYNLASKMTAGVQRGLILRNEKCNENFDCGFMTRLFSEEGKGIFTARSNVIGHMQQGRTPSAFDRNLGLTYGLKAVDWFRDQFQEHEAPHTSDESACLLGIVKSSYLFSPLMKLAQETDFNVRLPKTQWWLKLRPILKLLGRHPSTFSEGAHINYNEPAVYAKFDETSEK